MDAWLGKRLRMTITDGRVFEGIFECVDRDSNVVLADAIETRGSDSRNLGLIMVPGSHTTSILVLM
jgi:small nuclear ribonucleoprotein (snRNP)-like protein